MRLDYLSIFPAYFDVLDISLLGKAAADGLVRSTPTTCATGPTIAIAPWTTPRVAEVRAWS